MRSALCGLAFLAWAAGSVSLVETPPEFDRRIRESFAKAWERKHDKMMGREAVALMLYREAWPGDSPYANTFDFVHGLPPYPKNATLDAILRGEHGDASTWRLRDLTEEICLDVFAERPVAIAKAIADDLQGDRRQRRRAAQVLPRLKGALYRQAGRRTDYLHVREGKPLDAWKQIVEDLYPVAASQFGRLAPEDRLSMSEPLAIVLKELDDPRAISVLLGTGGRDLTFAQWIMWLQKDRKASPQLVALLADEVPEVREKAAYVLAESMDPALVPHAMRLLEDESPRVRRWALEMALFLLSPERPELQSRFNARLHDPDDRVRRWCVLYLAGRKDVACAPLLLEMLRDVKTDEQEHRSLVDAMKTLAGQDFGYGRGAAEWRPTTPNNRAALERFAAWIAAQQKN